MALQVGEYVCETLMTGTLRLDGGAMFGSVPRPIWEGMIPPDGSNRIQLAARVLLCRGSGRVVLVDTGCGEKYEEKEREIYGVEPAAGGVVGALAVKGVQAEEVTDVILTHLHFDHAGGVTQLVDGVAKPTFPRAVHHIQRDNLTTAQEPNPRERASYLAPNFQPLVEAGLLRVRDGAGEILPGIRVEVSNGHTRGMQIVWVEDPAHPLVFGADLVPTHAHLRLPFTMGYDLHAEWVMEEKRKVLDRLAATGGIIVFEHDPEVPACRVRQGKRYHELAEVVSM